LLSIDRRSIQNFDWIFLGIVVVLILCGLVNLVSATHAGVESGLSEGVRRQLMALAGGAFLLVVILLIDYRHFQRLAVPIYLLSLALLVLTLFLAPVTRGSQAWLFGGRLQPSEFAKIGLVLALARYFTRNPPGEMTQLRQFAIPIVILAIPVGLIVLQRDMGVALLTLLVALTYLPLVRVPFRAWVAFGAVGVAALAAIWSFGLAAYQQERILDFLDPGRDPLSSGYQAAQSRIAIGSGGVLGKGWLEGTQSQLRFLPTQHTDFAFSVLAEEWGFVGSVTTLGLYLLMLLWGLWIARNSRDRFGTMLAIGLVGTLFWPAAINVAMVLGLAPVIGVPLPLFSYGGSAMVAASISLALLLNISMRRWAAF
jgi:rod shape determining protein RodA